MNLHAPVGVSSLCGSRLRVMHVITGLSDGGAEGVLYRLVASDRADEHRVVSLTSEGKYGTKLRAAGVSVTTLDMPRGRVTLRGLRRLWRGLGASRPDVVQTWMYHADLLGGVAARFAGAPVAWGIRDTTLDTASSRRSTIWVAKACSRLSRWVPARIVCCAEAARKVHVALGYDAGRMVVIPNGYDLTRFAPDSDSRARLRREWGVDDDCPLLGMVARFDPQKDHANLIAALGQLRTAGTEFRAVLVGTGMDAGNPTLAAWIAKAGLAKCVRLLGPRTDIPAVMNALDVNVLSSAAEAFPNVLAEAMACGTPCVTTDVGDAARIVGDTGWVAPPQNAGALAAGIAQALAARQQAESWRARQQRARQRISEEFGMDKMVQRYRDVWAQVARRRM